MITDVSRGVAEVLLRSQAVSIDTDKQFVYSSGIVSPIYTDHRVLLSYPEERRIMMALLTELVLRATALESFDLVAGVATAGIPWASLLAERVEKPLVYVREAAKEHGKGQQVEGVLREGQRAIVIEDLVTTGGSVIEAAEGLREAGGLVAGCFAIFTYGLPQAASAMEAHSLTLHTPTRIGDLLEVAQGLGRITPAQRRVVEEWLESRARA